MKRFVSLAIILALMLTLGVPALAASSLRDVNPGSWFYNEVSEMVASGAIEGYEDNTLRPQSILTRAQAAALLYRAAHLGEPAVDPSLIRAAGYTKQQIVDYCLEAGVGSMYGDKGQSVNWGVPIRYYI